MLTRKIRSGLSVLLGFAVFITSAKVLSDFGTLMAAGDDTGSPTKAAPKSESELRSLVAPIALYPDNLVGEVLAASTFPDQVAIANYWLQQHQDLKGSALTQAVDKQSWNESVKALTQFPKVLNNMAKSLTWTSQLGEAYHDQRSEVMSAIQDLRKQAKAAGHLKSTSQMKVEQENPQTIVIQPANPDVVYVPEYNPAVIYGVPYQTPGYTGADVAAASAISFGAGIALGALAGGGGWGWNSWGVNWSGGTVNFNRAAFVGNTAWHGGYVGGDHPYGYDGGYHPYGAGTFNRNEFNRNEINRDEFNRNELSRTNMNHFSDANSWAGHNNFAGKSTAFSGLSHGFGGFGGWASRADSARGWGSMHASGFGGFHGGFHGFGGFHGGGFHGGRR